MSRAPALALLLSACAGASTVSDRLAPATPASGAALQDAVEDFYRAKDVAALREAVERARRAGPDSGAYHEVAAELALLEGRSEDRWDHLIRSLTDPADAGALLHLHELADLAPHHEAERARIEALLDELRRGHPAPEVRAVAAYEEGQRVFERGDPARAREILAELPGVLPLSIAGGWENDQGKGLTTPYPPEAGVDLDARYPGALVEIGWRRARAAPWALVDLSQQIVPWSGAVAYAASGFALPGERDCELRLLTTDPVRVFVDGALVLEVAEIKASSFDQLVIPLHLPAGDHRVLVKSAQREGSWLVMARLTGIEGAPIPGLAIRPADAGPAGAKLPAVQGTRALLERRVSGLPAGSVRRAVHLLRWTAEAVGGAEAIHRAEEVQAAAPGALASSWRAAGALWDGGENGRAADLLAELDARAGDELVLLRVKHARMWSQQNLQRRAREALEELVRRFPDRWDAYIELDARYEAEGWTEDRRALLAKVQQRWPEWRWGRTTRASVALALGLDQEAQQILEALHGERPLEAYVVDRLSDRLTDRGELDEAAELLRDLLRERPELLWARNRLAELERRRGDAAASEAELQAALAISPDSSFAWNHLATLAYLAGRRDLAIERWQAALARSPSDQKLANRLAYLVPAADGQPGSDVPDEPAIAAAIKAGAQAKALPGADEILALDDEVHVLHADGSAMSVVTLVRRAVTNAGLDRLREQRFGGGKTRVLTAYAVDPAGRRIEPSTLREGVVIFRGLQVGATVVLQYRVDVPPRAVLGRSMEGSWMFEGFRRQTLAARYVLWRPSDMPLLTKVTGSVPLAREERTEAGMVRLQWSSRDVPPAIAEENMPTTWESLTNVRFTTVPDWEAFTRWEAVLLDEALRPSDEVDRLARTFDARAPVAQRLEQIHAYLMKEVRYQQDYEDPIAGWRPHPTSMVLERRYGDCKDKANLFLMLARAVGIDARFALVRTREQGPVETDLPGLQFNHAIVYVPAQPGFPEGRFFDPTADELDLDVLPQMDQGTLSLVFDPATRRNEWVPIPLQDPAVGERRVEAKLTLAPDGSARGRIAYAVRGNEGSSLRRTARNEEQLRQMVSAVASWIYGGTEVASSRATGLDDLHARAGLEMDVSIPGAARLEGGELRLQVPGNVSVVPLPTLSQRRFPMLLNVPDTTLWAVEAEAPPGYAVRALPPPVKRTSACWELERTSRQSGATAHVEVRVTMRCERVGTQDYAATRRFLDEARRTLQDPVILRKK